MTKEDGSNIQKSHVNDDRRNRVADGAVVAVGDFAAAAAVMVVLCVTIVVDLDIERQIVLCGIRINNV